MIDKEWNRFCAESDLASAFVGMIQEAQNAENPREKIKRDVLNILRMLDQGPIEDPCDEQWNQFVRDFKSDPQWLFFLREAKTIKASNGKMLDCDLSWVSKFHDDGSIVQ